jgi:hypothetical protein
LKRLFALCMFILIVSGSTFAFGYEGNYQELFYPDGMPVKEGYFGTGPTVYYFYDDVEIPEKNLLFILYSEEIETSSYDNENTLFLAIVNKTGPDITDLNVVKIMNITDYINTGLEITGAVAELGGSTDVFSLTNEPNVLHVEIAGRLSGTASAISSSDVFFLVDTPNKSLSPILKLLDTAKFARAGQACVKYTYTNIYTLKNEETGMQILTQHFSYDFDARQDPVIDQGVLSPDINVYQYNPDDKKYSLTKTISELPAGTTKLERVVDFDTDCTSGCYE